MSPSVFMVPLEPSAKDFSWSGLVPLKFCKIVTAHRPLPLTHCIILNNLIYYFDKFLMVWSGPAKVLGKIHRSPSATVFLSYGLGRYSSKIVGPMHL